MTIIMLSCFVGWGLLLTAICWAGGWRGMAVMSAILSVICALLAVVGVVTI